MLDLRDNELTGTVPVELGWLQFQKILLLCENRFDGSIPVEIGRLSLLSDLQVDEISTTADAGVGCLNRKFDTDNQINNVCHVLVEESSNLAAISPNIKITAQLDPVVVLPSRSSGSFPAVPNNRKLCPAPGPSPDLDQKHTPDTTSPDVISQQSSAAGKSGNFLKLIVGMSVVVFLLIIAAVVFVICRRKAEKHLGLWKTGLTVQLQEAFVTGVPKLTRDELENACEDFSNIIRIEDGAATVYKGTLI